SSAGSCGRGGREVAKASRRRAGQSGPVIRSRSRASTFVGYFLLFTMGLVYLYPFVIQVANSFKTEPDAAAHPLSPIPDPFSLGAYERAFVHTDMPLWLANSVFVTLVVTVGRVLLDSMAGYALARIRFRGRGAIFAGIIAVMAVPGVVLL